MADKKTVDKVKELLDGHVYAPLKEAAEKWLAEAEDKYGDKFDDLKEKGGEAWEKLSESAEKFSEKSIEASEKLTKAGEKVADAAEKFQEKAAPKIDEFKEKAGPKIEEFKEKAGPKIDEFKEKAAPKLDEIKGKAAPVVDKVTESEFIKQLKAGIASLDEVIETFSKPEMKENIGEEAAEQIRKHAEAMKAEGKKYCDCPACTKAREILKDLGVDIDAPEAEAEEPEEAE